MVNLAQPISLWIVFGTVAAIVAMIALGILWVNKKNIEETK
jgi:hypothetical protein